MYKDDVVIDLIENECEVQDDDRGNSILMEEDGNANKALEVYLIFRLVFNIYETSVIPNDFNVKKTVTVPKKLRAEKFENYRILSLTTRASKIPTKGFSNRDITILSMNKTRKYLRY